MPNPFANLSPLSKLMLCMKCWSIMLSQWGFAQHTFPVGVTTTDTQSIYARIGGTVDGAGNGRLTRSDGTLINSKLRGQVSEVHSSASPAEVFAGAFWKSTDYTLRGGKVGTLIRHAPGSGSGEHYFGDRSWVGFETAVQFGELPNDVGCDSTTLERCWFTDCDNAIVYKNTMAMTNEFRNCSFSGVTNCIVLNGGGKSMADGLYINHADENNAGGAVLVIDPVPGTIGSNNNRFTLRNVNYDQQAGKYIALVRMRQHIKSGYWLTIDGGGVAYDGYGDGNYLLELRNPFHVTLRNFQGLQKGSVKIHHNPKLPVGKLVVDGCELRGVNFVDEILADDSPVVVVPQGGN